MCRYARAHKMKDGTLADCTVCKVLHKPENHHAHDLLPVLHRELERVGVGDAPLLNPLQGEGSEDLTVRLDEPEAGFAYEQVELSLDVACERVMKRGNSDVSDGSSS